MARVNVKTIHIVRHVYLTITQYDNVACNAYLTNSDFYCVTQCCQISKSLKAKFHKKIRQSSQNQPSPKTNEKH